MEVRCPLRSGAPPSCWSLSPQRCASGPLRLGPLKPSRPGAPQIAMPLGKAPARPAVRREVDGVQGFAPVHLLGYLYVNNNGTFNSVRAFRLLSDGRLESLPGSPYPAFARGAGSQVTFP